MCNKPILHQPDFSKHFYVQMDASAYGMGAVLSQEGEISTSSNSKTPLLQPVAYYSATFTLTEHNYDIYKHELLAIIKALKHWQQYLIWTKEPFTILTNHANLLYWKLPRKLNRCTARWHVELQDYNYEIKHVPGKSHVIANLSPPRVTV